MPIRSGDRPFDRLAADLIADQLAGQPVLGSYLGVTEYDDALPDMSADAVAARHSADDVWQERFAALPDAELTHDERIDRDLVVMVLRGRRVMRDWQGWRRNPDDYAGVALNGLFVLLLHRLRPEPELAQALAARLSGTPGVLAQGIDNLDADLASPELVQRALGMAHAGAAYARSIPGALAQEHQATLAEAAEAAAVAFEGFAAHLEELAGLARGEWAIGEARYDGLLEFAEGLSYGARELRDRGQSVYDRLAVDMRRRAKELRGDEDWRALLEELNADHPSTPEEMLAAYRDATDAARAFCVENDLVTLPAGEHCDVSPSAPFTRPMIAVAHYMAPPPFSQRRVGTFFVPYPPAGATPEQVRQRLATNSFSSRWTIAVHEAYPGHHWHLAHIATNLRRPLRFVFGSTYFTEGWGLYVEDMMREQGFFADPRWELCQVDARLFRAARIVVDTSLHLGEMTVEEAVEFMSTKASLSRETAQAEVLRYCAWPTQAASYLTGALEIARMAEDWLHTARGSLKDFHDAAAGTGRLPIALVERCLAAIPLT
jgi:uncharacterized protein (DUF885 family)